ncbi:hypothetical protein [Mycobacterium sp. pW045]|uniref:hypothetical protein n=1 Tax=Mycobacterium sp. pW045 TaxID=3238984 RepID=UPI00351B640C
MADPHHVGAIVGDFVIVERADDFGGAWRYHRPQTITGSRRFSRRSSLADYIFRQPTGVPPIPADKGDLKI